MSKNAYVRLAQLLPPPVVYVGRVLEHHDDDTSTVELPIGLATTIVNGAVARGSLIRPRGRTVPVGGWAFVRRGVIENQAPNPAPAALPVGAPVIVTPEFAFLDTFDGPDGTDIGDRPTNSGHTWPPFSNVVLNGSGATRTEFSGGGGYLESGAAVTLPAVGVAYYVEIEVQNATVVRLYLVNRDVGIPVDHQVQFELSSRFNYDGHVEATGYVIYSPSAFADVYADYPAIDARDVHVMRIEVSADHRTYTFRLDGATVGTVADYPVVPDFPLLGFSYSRANLSEYAFDTQPVIYRIQGGLL